MEEGWKVRQGSRRGDEEEGEEFDLREWRHLKARVNRRRANTSNSRRYSASYVGNGIRDEDDEDDDKNNNRSFRSNFTISSTASSPGYKQLRDEIDPSTYSFTTALKALQGRSGYAWDCCLSPEGFALNSKWYEAERYICNPLSGQVPMECLSAKTLSGRSFHSLVPTRITMSVPVVYSAKPTLLHNRRSSLLSLSKPPMAVVHNKDDDDNNKAAHVQKQEDKDHVPTTPPTPTTTTTTPQDENRVMIIKKRTRDVGTQSGPPYHPSSSSSSASPFSTPSFKEKSIIRRPSDRQEEDHDEHGFFVVSSSSLRTNISSSSTTLGQVKVKEIDGKTKEDEEREDHTKRNNKQEEVVQKLVKAGKHGRQYAGGGCLLSLKNLWFRRRQTQKHKTKRSTGAIFFHHCLNISEY